MIQSMVGAGWRFIWCLLAILTMSASPAALSQDIDPKDPRAFGFELIQKGDYEGARTFFEGGCIEGRLEFCNLSASLLAGPDPTEEQYANQRVLLTDGCEAGRSLDCLYLALYQTKGWGGEEDFGSARSNAVKACDQKVSAACLFAFSNVYLGRGGPTDKPAALEYLAQACSLGSVDACELVPQIQEMQSADRSPE